MTPRDLLELIRRAWRTTLPAGVARRPEAKLVLVCLATHADPDGTNAYPSRDTIATYCELGTRTVDKILRDLAAARVIAEDVAPTFARPRTWRVQNLWTPCAEPCGKAVDAAGGAPPGGSQIDLTLTSGSQMTRGSDAKSVPPPHSFATDQVQIQKQKTYEERAAALRAATLLTADGNYKVILRLAHAVLDVVNAGPARVSLAEVVEAVKEQCARAHIVYSSAVVHRAVASALVQRVKLAPIEATLASPGRKQQA